MSSAEQFLQRTSVESPREVTTNKRSRIRSRLRSKRRDPTKGCSARVHGMGLENRARDQDNRARGVSHEAGQMRDHSIVRGRDPTKRARRKSASGSLDRGYLVKKRRLCLGAQRGKPQESWVKRQLRLSTCGWRSASRWPDLPCDSEIGLVTTEIGLSLSGRPRDGRDQPQNVVIGLGMRQGRQRREDRVLGFGRHVYRAIGFARRERRPRGTRGEEEREERLGIIGLGSETTGDEPSGNVRRRLA